MDQNHSAKSTGRRSGRRPASDSGPSERSPLLSTTRESVIDGEWGSTDGLLNDDVRRTDPPREPVVSRAEEWAYYLYYNGDNGVGPNSYAPLLFQILAVRSAVDPVTRQPCPVSADGCVLRFLGHDWRVSSIVLLANGASLLLMTLLFTTLGSTADYGNASSGILLAATVVCWAAQLGFLLIDEGQWRAAMALYVAGMVSYGTTLVFYASVFPRLARNTPASRAAQLKAARADNDSSVAERKEAEKAAEEVEALERARLSSHSTAHSNWGYLFVLLLSLPLMSSPSSSQHILALTVAYWFVLALPWFILQKPRPGPPLPKGASWLTVGWKQVISALKEYKQLPYTFAYLAGIFLLADGVNTTGIVVKILQVRQTSFSIRKYILFELAQAACSIIGCYACLYLQSRSRVRSKTVLSFTNIVSVLIPAWGLLGLRKGSTVGFKADWEFWAYNITFGLGQAPYYAYSQAVMADLTPPGLEGMWFGLFGLTNRASSLIGPYVSVAIIDGTGNDWAPFAFLTPVCVAAAIVIAFGVDARRGHEDAVDFAARKRGQRAELSASGDPTDLQ